MCLSFFYNKLFLCVKFNEDVCFVYFVRDILDTFKELLNHNLFEK